MRALRPRGSAALLALLLALSGCREGSGNDPGGALPIPLPASGADGCTGPDQAFGSLVPVAFATLDVGPQSQMAASVDVLGASGTYELYVTGEAATVVRLDFDPADPDAPMAETVLVAPGDVDSLPEYVADVPGPAVLSGVAVLDPSFLVVVEETGNTLLLVSRTAPGDVSVFPGLAPDDVAGNADGAGGLVRFAFTRSTQVVATGDGRLFVADPGNHSVRMLFTGGLPQAFTVAGTGAPFFADGSLDASGFDTPAGLALTCDGRLLVTEVGAGGAGGHRLRALEVGEPDFFGGGFTGSAATLAGDGAMQTVQGAGAGASLDTPVSPVTTAGGEVYWVDAGTGVLRRYRPSTGVADCPFFASCAAATGVIGVAPNFASTGGGFSLVVAENDALYALDADAEALFRVAP